jgi:hypothetical protein
MLVIQVLVARLFVIRHLGVPTTLFHYLLGPENGVLVMVVPIDTVVVLDQMGVVYVPPPITVPDEGKVPGGVVDCAMDQLTDFNGLWHRCLLWLWV